MEPLRTLLKALATTWGLLATLSVLFPGAAAFFGLPLAPENSLIKGMYVAVASVLAALALLYVANYRDTLAVTSRARRVSLWSAGLAVLFLFGFLVVRLHLLSRIEQRVWTRDGVEHMESDSLAIQRRASRPDPTTGSYGLASDSIRPNPWEVPAIALLSGAMMALTVSFAALGVNEAQKVSSEANST